MKTLNNLPWNQEAEQRLLSIFLDERVDTAEMLDKLIAEYYLSADDFYNTAYRSVYNAMIQLRDTEQSINFAAVVHKLNVAPESAEFKALKDIALVYSPQNAVGHYVKLLKELSKRRRYILTAEKIGTLAADTSQTFDLINDSIEKLIGFEDEAVTIREAQDLFVDVYSEIVERYSGIGDIPGHRTGWNRLDKIVGGLGNGELIIIGARPGMGKSIMAGNIAEYTALHECKKALIFSLEMPGKQVLKRILSSVSGLLLEDLNSGKIEAEDFGRISDIGSIHELKNLLIDDNSMAGIDYIKSTCRAAKRRYKELGVIIIDYLQLMQTPLHLKNRLEAVSEISRSLKLLAKELDCPIVALSQLNRANERERDKRPKLSDLRESGALEQDADKVFLLYRDEYYDKDTVDKGVLEVIVAKCRDGKTGRIKLSWQPQIMRIMDPQEVKRIEEERRKRGIAEQVTLEDAEQNQDN